MKEESRLFKKFGRLVPAGTILFQEGEVCEGMYIIQKGRVRLYKKVGREEVTIDRLGDGGFFGEVSCLLEQPRSVNGVAEEDRQVLLIVPEVLEELFR